MTCTIAYRPNLDGLWALTVGFVNLYYLDASWLPGGFLGVGMFFVLSGIAGSAEGRRKSA